MNWKEKLTGVRWEHKDAEIRRQAVAQLDDPRLERVLPELATRDPDAGVRMQALQRLNSEAWWLESSATDEDPQVRALADRQLPRFFLQPAADATYLEQRIRWLERGHSSELLHSLAIRAADPELRAAALRNTTAQGFLGDRVVEEPEPELARLALSRLTQHSTLERIFTTLRKRNKERAGWVQTRITELSAQAAAPASTPRFATLCRELEQLSRGQAGGGLAERLNALVEEWHNLPGKAEPLLQRRFDAAAAIIREAIENPVQSPSRKSDPTQRLHALLEIEDANVARTELEHIEQQLGSAQPASINDLIEQVKKHIAALDTRPHHNLKALLDRIGDYRREAGKRPDPEHIRALTSEWDRQWNRIELPTAADEQIKHEALGMLAALREAADLRRARQARDLGHVSADLDAIEKALEDGDLAGAQRAIHAARADFKRMSRPEQQRHSDLNARINRLFGKLKEIRDWQRWSNDKLRKQLIQEISELPQHKLHPDAVAAKLKEARATWQRLEAQEILPEDKKTRATSPWMWRKFQAACNAAYGEAKPFFEKRESLQQEKHAAVQQFIDTARAQVDAATPDFRAIEGQLRQARNHIRRLDDLPPGARRDTAQALRELMDQLTRRLEQHWDEVEKLKQKLIHEARQLEHEPDPAKAVATAKSLQRRWQEGGATHRRREQTLWKEFRAAMDPLFERHQQQRAAHSAQQQQARSEIEALCAEAEQLARVADSELGSATGRMAGLSRQWQDTKVTDRNLHRRFDQAVQTLQRRLREQERSALQASRADRETRIELLQSAWQMRSGGHLDEAAREDLLKRWPSSDDDAAASAMRALLDIILGDDESAIRTVEKQTEESAQTARAVLIALEFLAGQPSPDDQREARMAYQVKRLSEQLAGDGTRRELGEEVAELTDRWLACIPLPPDQAEVLQKRYSSVMKSLDEMIANA